VLTAPFFVLVYDLITQSYAPVYDIMVLNNEDRHVRTGAPAWGDSLIVALYRQESQGWKITEVNSREEATARLKNRKADLLMIIPDDFSKTMTGLRGGVSLDPFDLEFLGNITDINYMVSAILTYSFVSGFVTEITGIRPVFNFVETPLGISGQLSEFEMAVPGLVIFSIIMLMLTASVAMIAEVENKTMLRLKMSRVTTLELMGGITLVQVLVGFISVAITLCAAAALGFRFQGSMALAFMIILLTTVSIIAFSLFIAAFSKSVTQVLIIGNFPLFIFMFFTGAMFPMNVTPWFTVGGYPVSLISLMSPTHAVSALSKVLVMQQGFTDVLPELASIVFLCIVYFLLGIRLYQKRHMT
jgi:ABC-2 type transport system permease protein